MEKEFWAKIYDVDFPVCTEEQKVKLEEAYRSSVEYEKRHGTFKTQCFCDLLIALHSPDTPRGAAIAAAWELARRVYVDKMAITKIAEMLQEEILRNAPVSGRAN